MPQEPLPAIAGGFHTDPGKIDPRVSHDLGELLVNILQADSKQKLAYAIKSVGMAGFVAIIAEDVSTRIIWSTLIDAAYRAIERDAGNYRMMGSNLVANALQRPKEVAP